MRISQQFPPVPNEGGTCDSYLLGSKIRMLLHVALKTFAIVLFGSEGLEEAYSAFVMRN